METQQLWECVQHVREQSPLVHNITNLVVMNNTANALLSIGASPIMAHAHSEVQEMVSICNSLVINIGTLDEYTEKSFLLAAEKANETGKPWVLDPVGAGATPYRNEVLSRLLTLRPSVIRGNASEILALAKANTDITKGADSTVDSVEAINAAKELNQKYGSIICISGKTDIIVSNHNTYLIYNGNSMMTKVTGLGCSATAVIGAFIAGANDHLAAVCAAAGLFSLCGELAAHTAKGPGSLQTGLLDQLYAITQEEFITQLKISRYEQE